MSTFDDDLDNDDDVEPEQPQKRQPTEADIRMWRRDAKKYAEAGPRLTQLERENLLLRTPGLNTLSEKQTRALFATHDGELTPDLLRATAQDLGFVEPPPPDVPDAEREAHQRMQDAAAGAAPTPGADDPSEAARIAQMTPEQVVAWAAANGRLEL